MTPTVADKIGKYLEIRDFLEAKEAEYSAWKKTYVEAMTALEGSVTQDMLDQNETSIKTEKGTAYRQEWTSAKVADREAFLEFVINTESLNMLTNHVSKEEVKAYIEEHNGAPPPGIDFTKGMRTNFRKAG